MIKFVANFLFVLIIFILSTALPLSMDIFSLDLSPVIIKEPSDIDKTFQVNQYTLNILETDANQIKFEVQTTNGILDNYWKEHLSLSVKNSHGVEEIINPVTATPDSSNQIFTIDLTTWLKSKRSDNYLFTLNVSSEINNIKIVGNQEWNVFYTNPDLKYIQEIPSIKEPLSRIVFYYPTEDEKHIVPVTLDMNVSTNYWRLLYDYYSTTVPEGLGLKSPSPILKSPNIQLQNGTAYIYYYTADVENRESDISLSHQLVADTFFKNGTFKSVQFFYNNGKPKEFGGIDWSKSPVRSTQPTLYFGFEHLDNRLLLEPSILKGNSLDVTDETVEQVYNTLTFKNTDFAYNESWILMSPSNLTLNAHTFENGLLTLDFSSALNDFYKEHPQLYRGFIESLILSYRSYPAITQVQFTVDGNPPLDESLLNSIKTIPVINYQKLK